MSVMVSSLFPPKTIYVDVIVIFYYDISIQSTDSHFGY